MPGSANLRPGTPDDSRACFDLFVESVVELGQQLGVETITGGAEAVDQLWPRRRSMLEHLAATADGWWVAERNGRLAGYARSVLRDGVRELTEFFVRPDAQSAGLGGELLARAFAADGARARILLATPDARALIRYLKAGLVASCPVFHFHRAPRRLPPVPGLEADRLTVSQETFDRLAAVDRDVLGFRRDPEHRWLLSDREGWWYTLNGRPLGYGYIGSYSGPFAALDPAGFGAMLAHAESVAHSSSFGVDAPLINRAALDYLLTAGYRMDPFANYFMSDRPIGSLDRYLVSTPSVFL